MVSLQFTSRQAGDTNNWHLPMQADLAALNTDLTDIRGDSVPSNGVTDAGPEIQRLYDAGISWRGKSTGTYLINTPVFFDKADVYGRYSMDFNGAKIILGSGLPTTPQFFRDDTTQWAFFANTKRTALSGGVVTVSTANRASGTTGQLMPVIIRNCTVNGQSANRGLMFGNRSGARFESVTLLNGRTLYSWDDYSDVASFIDCHNRGNVITDSALLTQINPGDGVVIDGCKADAGMYIAHMSNCHGASIRGSITGRFAFIDSAVKFDGAHQENISNTVNIKSIDSHITFDRCVMYPARSTTVPMLEVADSTGFSHIAVRDSNPHRLNASGATADDPWGPWLSFTTVTDGTKVVFDNSFATDVSTLATSDGYLPGAFGIVTATGTAATAMGTGLTAVAAQSKMATGSFSIQKINGVWAVRNMDGSSGGVIGAIANPTMTTTLGKLTGGTLVNGTTYSYVCAVFDQLGRSTGRSALVTAVMTSAGTARLKINGAPGLVRIWRKATATGADTAPTHYVDIGMSGGTVVTYDTGANCAGEPWLTTSIPASTTTNSCTATAHADGAAI